jgi:hypothetical protein
MAGLDPAIDRDTHQALIAFGALSIDAQNQTLSEIEN